MTRTFTTHMETKLHVFASQTERLLSTEICADAMVSIKFRPCETRTN